MFDNDLESFNDDKRAIAKYARESTKRQAKDGYNLQGQDVMMDSYINFKRFKGDIILYEEYGASAKNLKRPKVKALIDDIKANKIKAIIVYKLDRLIRRLASLNEILQIINKHDVVLISVVEEFNTHTAMGKMVMNFITMLAEWELDTISERTNDGLKNGAIIGNYIKGGNAPFGYRRFSKKEIIEVNGRQKEITRKGLKKHKEESKVVEYIFDMAYKDMSFLEIALKVNEHKYMKKIHKTYGEHQIRAMLHNSIYYGIMMFQGEEYEINIEPIITRTYFEQVGRIISRRAKVCNNDYLYRNKVYCSCGNMCEQKSAYKQNARSYDTYLYYYCPVCQKRINETYINEIVIERLAHYRKNTLKDNMLKEFQSELNIIDELRENVYDLLIKKEISMDTYIKMMSKYEDKYIELKKQYDYIVLEYSGDFMKLQNEEKRKIIRKSIDNVIVDINLKMPIKISMKESKKR